VRTPDFFIVGAPKCGTTALHEYLVRHPDVFMTRRKDISYFGRDLEFRRPEITRERYLTSFAEARGQRRVGEASVWYLFSTCAAAEIKAFCPHASIIVMLRNPIDMLHAQHSEFLYNCNEDIADFAEALAAESDRRCGARIPATAHLVQGLFYRETARFAEQVERYFDMFGRASVHVIIFDDLVVDPAAVFQRTLTFLEVNPDVHIHNGVVNPNKTVRSRFIQRWLMAPPPRLMAAYDRYAPKALHGRVLDKLRRLNTRTAPRPPMDPVLKRQLQREFAPEVRRLSALLDRDLMTWCPE
jgi:hypothetical protein